MKKETIYHILDHIEKKPAMYLGNAYGIKALNLFIAGYCCAGGRSYDEDLNVPDFQLFTSWLGGILEYEYENSSGNWSWLLLERYNDDRYALNKFFNYLAQFKTSIPKVQLIELTKDHIDYSKKNKIAELWCIVGNTSGEYFKYLSNVDKVVLFKLHPSRTLFSLLIDKDNRVIESRNIDMTESTLRNKIEKQFGIDLDEYKPIDSKKGVRIMKQYNLI
jgi:hypothetical protein